MTVDCCLAQKQTVVSEIIVNSLIIAAIYSYTSVPEWPLLYVAFCLTMTISRQKEARSREYALLVFRMTSRVFYSAQYHMQYCTLQAFKQFGPLMHNHNDKYPARSGFAPGTSSWYEWAIGTGLYLVRCSAALNNQFDRSFSKQESRHFWWDRPCDKNRQQNQNAYNPAFSRLTLARRWADVCDVEGA